MPINYGSKECYHDYRAFGKSLQVMSVCILYVIPLTLFLSDRVILI